MTRIRFVSSFASLWLITLLLFACSQHTVQQTTQPPLELPVSLPSYSDPQAEPARAVLSGRELQGVSSDLAGSIATIGATLERVLPGNTLSIRYTLLNSLSVNAVGFADGQIALTSGALAVFDQPDMLAALFAHQMAHVIAGHRVVAAAPALPDSSYLRNLSADERKLVKAMARLRYTTEQEIEADQLARELLRRGAYDDHLYRAFLKRINTMSGADFVTLQHSHPGLNVRLNAVGDTAAVSTYNPQHDPEIFRRQLSDSKLYRHYGAVHLNSQGVGFTDSGLLIRFGEAGQWQRLDGETGAIRLGAREVRFRQFRGEDREEKMRAAFRSYNIDAGGILSRLDRFRAKSWVSNDSCLLLESLALKPALLVFSETVKGNCDGVTHRGFAAITAQQASAKTIASEFAVRLGYRGSVTASTNPVLKQRLLGDVNSPLDEVLNPEVNNRITKAILY